VQSQAEKGKWLRDRHQQPGLLVLPNAWDPGTAVMMAHAGFPAIATTSAGIAFALGMPDGEHIGRVRMLEQCRQIARAVSVPVTADLEAGYGPQPEQVAETVQGAIDVGLVGCNIEDGAATEGGAPLFDIKHACERVRAGAEAARQSEIPFVLNARVDCYLARPGDKDNFAESVKRGNAYREAGADCIYVPGPMAGETIGRLVHEIRGPLNVLGARAGKQSPLSISELEQLGVRRVTLGGSLSLAALKFVRDAVRELLDRGTFTYAEKAGSNAEINELMRSIAEARSSQAEWARSTRS
jgi:2-methylisocitrate lyase-like PEP mutase family enzyme